MEIKKEEIISFAKAKKILENRSKDKELGYEQNNALEYLKKFSKLSMKKTKEMMEELGKVSKLKDKHKIMIINHMPNDTEDLRLVFAHEIISLSEDDKKTILKIVKKFC